jgi:excisionase family DNA binding protein
MANSVNPSANDHDTLVVEPVSVRIREACRLTGIGRSKFYELVASGEIEVVKIGTMTLVPFKELRGFIDRAHKAAHTPARRHAE